MFITFAHPFGKFISLFAYLRKVFSLKILFFQRNYRIGLRCGQISEKFVAKFKEIWSCKTSVFSAPKNNVTTGIFSVRIVFPHQLCFQVWYFVLSFCSWTLSGSRLLFLTHRPTFTSPLFMRSIITPSSYNRL